MAALAIASGGILNLSENVSAQNLTPYNCLTPGSGTWHCFSEYDVAAGGDLEVIREDCDLIAGCPTGDSHIDVGGVIYDGCLHPGHAINGGNPSRDFPTCGWVTETYYIEDDVANLLGPGFEVGGFYCVDQNGDEDCGDPYDGERGEAFCDHIVLGPVNGGSAFTLAYFVDGPVFQALDCGNLNTWGGTTGTVSIWLTSIPAPECADGIDNADTDVLVDYPADPGCQGFWDPSEVSECEDGVDNADDDAVADFAGGDVGCSGPGDNDETGPCEDDADNDGDGFTDFSGGTAGALFADPGCAGPNDPSEGPGGGPVPPGTCVATVSLTGALSLVTNEAGGFFDLNGFDEYFFDILVNVGGVRNPGGLVRIPPRGGPMLTGPAPAAIPGAIGVVFGPLGVPFNKGDPAVPLAISAFVFEDDDFTGDDDAFGAAGVALPCDGVARPFNFVVADPSEPIMVQLDFSVLLC